VVGWGFGTFTLAIGVVCLGDIELDIDTSWAAVL